MNLGRRFFVSNSIAVLVAILVTAVAALVFFAAFGRVTGSDSDMKSLTKLYEIRTGFGDIKRRAAALKAEDYLRVDFRNELALSIRALGADAVLIRNREVLFQTGRLDKLDIEKCIGNNVGDSEGSLIELGNRDYLIDRYDFPSAPGYKESLILIAPVKLNTWFYQCVIVFTIVFFCLVFMGMNLWVSFSFSKGVISPITRLRKAAAQISAGDLDCEIVEEGEGEVRELGRTLEQMRIKLKESIHMQQKYDENRKFLISSISHDLKTPVTSIKGYIEGIIDGIARTPEKMENYLETARSKAILVNSMIDDLLLYSKLDLKQIPFNFERTDLKKYFEDCVTDHKYEFEKANIKIEFQCDLKEPLYALIDKERLQRVFQNILENSRKYMDKANGKVSVILRETRTSAIIEIKDDGKGIPEEAQPYIFDRFYRADASRKSSDGSGLGLAIAKEIVEGHDGRIWAVSDTGKGTSIMISLQKNE